MIEFRDVSYRLPDGGVIDGSVARIERAAGARAGGSNPQTGRHVVERSTAIVGGRHQ